MIKGPSRGGRDGHFSPFLAPTYHSVLLAPYRYLPCNCKKFDFLMLCPYHTSNLETTWPTWVIPKSRYVAVRKLALCMGYKGRENLKNNWFLGVSYEANDGAYIA